MMWIKKHWTTVFLLIILLIGAGLLGYPTFADWWNSFHQSRAIAGYSEEVSKIDDATYALAWGAGSRRGTGGMRTKLQAAELATSQGIDTIVTNGQNPEALYDIVKGKKVGTLFVAK